MEASYQTVLQENVPDCLYGKDIYDVCGNILPNNTERYSNVCVDGGRGSYCSSGIYGRSWNTNISLANKTINDFPHDSVSYLFVHN